VLIGSRLWATEEALVHPNMKAAALAATGDDTIRSTVMDVARRLNWPDRYTCRVLKNAFTERWHDDLAGLISVAEGEAARWAAAWEAGDTATANTFVGEATGLIDAVRPAEEIVRAIAAEAEALLGGGWRRH
jgi:nitronate monooxygenase